jgi:hypothetical protein
MDALATTRERLASAAGLPAVLDAAYQAFLAMLPVIQDQQDRAGPEFAAFVLAGGSAAHGRFAISAAPSLPAMARAITCAPGSAPAMPGREAAVVLAEISELLIRRLSDVMPAAAGADHRACTEAVRHARSVSALLGGAAPR